MQQFKRSRLERREEDQITKKTLIVGGISMLLFVVLLVFGLPLLIRFSVFLGNIKSNNTTNLTDNSLPPLPPRIFVPFEATNGATINISGLAEPKTKAELLKDDVVIQTKDVGASGDFVFDKVTLSEGRNVFTSRVISEKNLTSDFSKTIEVELDQKQPEITMVNPTEETLTVDYADFDIVGQSEKGVGVTVSGRVAMMDYDGKFKLKMQLVPGKNDIEIIAKDLAGNETKKKITITYDI